MPLNVVRLDDKVLQQLIRESPEQAKAIIKSSAFQIEDWAKERVPRDPRRPPKDPQRPVTGRLRNSIQADFENNGFTAIIHDGVEYGIWQEFGNSRGMPARPWLIPAVERMRKIWDDAAFWRKLFDV